MVHLLVTVVAVVAVLSSADARPGSSRQLLPPKPGYVPVYIRNGDTPLEDINLELAEAFHAIPSGRSAGRNNIMAQRSDDDIRIIKKTVDEPEELEIRKDENVEERVRVDIQPEEISIKENDVNEIKSSISVESQDVSEHIQKIGKGEKL